ncbi:MAG: hypothetical protein H6Q47_259, partial [Deltaproteobacteria bacterium]|nr:hypothetical protein [Deltaproteobacteria bacterium]
GDLKGVIVGKDQLITSLVSKISQKDSEITQKNQYLIELESSLQNIYTSQGWKILLKYYKIRDKILPLNSVRRRLLKDSFNFLLSIPTYLTKKKTESTGGRLYFHIETDLSKPLIVGAGNAIYLHGWCFHTSRKIKKLSILVDNAPHRVFNFALARKDVFQQHFQNVESRGNSLNSGFWVILPFNRIDIERHATLSISAELSNREICTSAIGALHLKPAFSVNRHHQQAFNKESKIPFITICMTTYNPSIGHFQKQI